MNVFKSHWKSVLNLLPLLLCGTSYFCASPSGSGTLWSASRQLKPFPVCPEDLLIAAWLWSWYIKEQGEMCWRRASTTSLVMFNAEQSVAHCDTTTLLIRDMVATERRRSNILKIAFERQSNKLIRSSGATQWGWRVRDGFSHPKQMLQNESWCRARLNSLVPVCSLVDGDTFFSCLPGGNSPSTCTYSPTACAFLKR